MKIGIIGAGISGLTAAYELSKKGHSVVVFERSNTPGGLGTYLKIGDNYIERYYHHFFESDKHIISYAKEFGISDKLKFYRAKTGIMSNGRIHKFSSISDLLKFKPLTFFDRIRCGITLGLLKFTPVPLKFLDKIPAYRFMILFAGNQVYKKIWKYLLEGKFAEYAKTIPSLWLWGRIRDRSFKLGYFDGSVKILFDKLISTINELNGKIILEAEVTKIFQSGKQVFIYSNGKKYIFDKVVLSTVSPIAEKLVQNKLSKSYREFLQSIDHLGAVCVILELKHPVQSQYWLNICQDNAPVLVMVEHTNFLHKKNYGNKHVVYLANYVHRSLPHFRKTDAEILKEYVSILKQINKKFNKKWIINQYISRVPRAQTIFKMNALNNIPNISTPLSRIYLINIDQMYPHDRNLNQGIELGKKVVKMVDNS